MPVPSVAGSVKAASGRELEVRSALNLVKLGADVRGLVTLDTEDTLKTTLLLGNVHNESSKEHRPGIRLVNPWIGCEGRTHKRSNESEGTHSGSKERQP